MNKQEKQTINNIITELQGLLSLTNQTPSTTHKKYNTVLIVGNGFDLSLGMKTSYSDFIKSPEFSNHLSSNFKSSVMNIHYDNIFDYLQNKYNKLQVQNINWIDIEAELKEYAKNKKITIKEESVIRENKPNISNSSIKNSFNDLKYALIEYLNRIKGVIPGNSFSTEVLDCIASESNNLIVSFNYTDIVKPMTVSRNADIVYMHKTLKDNDIIFGFNRFENLNDMGEGYNYMIKSHQTIDNIPQLSNILLDADNVIVFGHSLGGTDFDYFKKYFKTIAEQQSPDKSRSFAIITKNNDAFDTIMANIDILTGNKSEEFRNNITFERLCTDNAKINDFTTLTNKMAERKEKEIPF